MVSTIIEKNCWDARCILVFVFLTAGANFRPCFSNNNVHVLWILLQPISLPYPQTMLRGPTRKLATRLLSTLYSWERGPNSITAIKSFQHFSFFNYCRFWKKSRSKWSSSTKTLFFNMFVSFLFLFFSLKEHYRLLLANLVLTFKMFWEYYCNVIL